MFPARNKSSDPPAWMESPEMGKSGGNTEEAGGDGKASGAAGTIIMGKAKKKSRRSSFDSARTSYGGYESDEDDELNEEDCCCCPMDPILFGISMFHFMCFFLGFAGMATNIYCMSRTEDRHPGNYQNLVLRAYATCFCAMIMTIEVNWRTFVKRVKLLDLWIFRGLFYVYTGLQTTGEIKSFDLEEVSKPQDLVGIAIFVAGLLYTAMGTCCIKSVAESKRKAAKYRGVGGDIESV